MSAIPSPARPGRLVGSWFLVLTHAAKGGLYATARALAVAAFPADARLAAFQPDLAALLEKAGRFELYSLSPQRRDAGAVGEGCHTWKVLGKTTVQDAATRKKVVDAFKSGGEASTPLAAGCFKPRHGIRLTHEGKVFDFVICFECFYVRVFNGARDERAYRTTGAAAGPCPRSKPGVAKAPWPDLRPRGRMPDRHRDPEARHAPLPSRRAPQPAPVQRGVSWGSFSERTSSK